MEHACWWLYSLFTSSTLWTAVAAVTVIFYTYYARQQLIATEDSLREARRSADAAQEALRNAREGLRISVRPWVGIADAPGSVQTSPVQFDANGNATVQYSLTVRNYSENAAQNVMAVAFLMVTEDLEAIKAKQLEASGDNYVGKPDMGFLLFPGKESLVHFSASRFERVNKVSRNHTGQFQAFLAGCVGYRDQFRAIYHSNFIYRLVDPQTQRPVQFHATPNTSVNGVFVPWHTFID